MRMQGRRIRKTAVLTGEDCFGRTLREIRKERGLSQEELAFESGLHPTYIGHLERGRKSPSLRTILRLAHVLETPGSEMLKRTESLLQHQGRTKR